jgi:queuine tRNA-ribosyltransferase
VNTFAFSIDAVLQKARAGTLELPHGPVHTPVFMPVGTQGTVRALSPRDLRDVGAQIVLGNTYHLHVRPGEEVVQQLGGLHRFMGWDGGLLTDSGGFQVFSLEGTRTVDDEGVTFRSHVDGGQRRLTPERAVEIQWALGPDIAMAFDHVIPGTAKHPAALDALQRTTKWLERCRRRHDALSASAPNRQTLWPILQGGVFADLRRQAMTDALSIGEWTGLAIGGLAVGETKIQTAMVLEGLAPSLPPHLPRYLMGVGFPEDLLTAVAAGVDLFDCVAPTRNGRNGSAYTPDGRINIRNAAYRTDALPLDSTCDCETCTVHSRGYLRHLFTADELLGLRLLSLHNVRFLVRLMEEARRRIVNGTFDTWHREWLERYHQRGNG